MTSAAAAHTVSIDDILVTDELEHRPSRPPDFEGENKALVALAQCLSTAPESVLQRLVDSIMELTGSESAGISISEMDAGKPIFRWHATTGQLGPLVRGTMPREFSPCGTVLDLKKTLLMEDAVRFYPYMSQLQMPCREILLVPFSSDGELIGTVWSVAHSEPKHFDAEDKRLMTSMANFASMATKTLSNIKALQDTFVQQQQVHRRQTDFIATLAHELRNPLAPLKSGLHILNSEDMSENGIKVRGMMGRQISHMTQLVDDLLDISRIAHGKIDLKLTRIDLDAIILAAIEACQPQIIASKHTASVQLESPSIYVDGDPTRLTQVISNLLTNAARYTPPGGQILVSTQSFGDKVQIKVVDNGMGLEPQQLHGIFEMFGQVDQTINRAEGGLGIGLSLSKSLVEMQSGTIYAESPGLGMGSTFTVELPISKGVLSEPAQISGDTSSLIAQALKILIIEDNQDNAQSLAIVLRLAGHVVEISNTASEGLEAVALKSPDVILLDLGLPDISGYEVARQLRASNLHREKLIVALSGWGSEDDREKTKAAGFDFHLLKPVDPDFLLKYLATYADASKAA